MSPQKVPPQLLPTTGLGAADKGMMVTILGDGRNRYLGNEEKWEEK